jgi:hypothetical protein
VVGINKSQPCLKWWLLLVLVRSSVQGLLRMIRWPAYAAFTDFARRIVKIIMSQSPLDFTTPLNTELYVPTPKTPQCNCTRDERLCIQTLFLYTGWSKDDIALQLNVTPDQIRYALAYCITPQKQRSGRRPLLGPSECKQLVE